MYKVAGHNFPRKLTGPLPMAVKAEGVWITDAEGKRYLDASGGAVVVNLGHGRAEIAQAVHEQIMNLHYAHPTMFTCPTVERLADALASHAPAAITRFYFLSGGAEAVETAIKLARQVHLANNRPQRIRLIARWKSYHGLTLGALAATGRTTFRAPYAPLLSEVFHIPAPYCLRCDFGLKHPDCGLRCAQALEDAIEALGPETVSAFLGETVSGATIAAVPPPPGYWPRIREICDRYGVYLIQDEVMCGLGRTGRWFASEHYGVVPDIVTFGKGISGGTVALSAVGCREELFEACCANGSFVHGGTYSHHPVAAAAGLAALGILERERLVERVAEMGPHLGRLLVARLGDHPQVADVRGIGFMWGVEFVADRASLRPYPRSEQVTERLWSALFKAGLITYKSTGLAGVAGDALVVAPPYVATAEDMEFIVDRLGQAVEETLGR
ncbi:MAG: aspartate aminotransferase family protein [Thermodesulfobacteriota bacterium]